MKNNLQNKLSTILFPNSIQKRLPASYALIALLVAVSLGGVLIGTLSEYYHRQEMDYLQRNATAIKVSLARLLESGASEADLQAQVNLFAFFSGTQIDILNPEDELMVASDSLTSVINMDEEQPGVRLIVRQLQDNQTWLGLPELPLPAVNRTTTEFIVEDGVVVETVQEQGFDIDTESIDFIRKTSSAPTVNHSVVTDENQVFVSFESGLYGFGLVQNEDDISNSVRSSQAFSSPIMDIDNNLLGTLRLSNGPAYGVEIVTSVAWGWLFASIFSIALAIIVGFFISRDVSRPLLVLTDTTKRMTAGDLSTRVNLQRNDELGTLAKAFNDMATQIESTISTLHHFVSDAAHEINTPITALRTNLELINATQSTEQNAITINRAVNQVIRLQDLTHNLLQLSRLESGVADEPLQSINLTALLRETVGFYASRADQANIDLELSFPRQAIMYTAHDTHLRTAISNLLDNAIKFTPQDGRVSIDLEQTANEIAIHIRDTGVGILPDHIPYVFNRFHRAPNVSNYAGSGLGLSIVRTIIEQYDGYISIKNLECGTRVSIFLPVN